MILCPFTTFVFVPSAFDEDLTTFDIITIIAYVYLFEVISDKTHAIIYLCYSKQKYFTCFYFMPKCRMVEHLYEPRVMTREEEMVGCYSRGPLMSKEIISCCSRSSLTSLLAQEKIESKSLTLWTQIRTAHTLMYQNVKNFYNRTPNWVILFGMQSRFYGTSSPIESPSNSSKSWRYKIGRAHV